MLPQFTKVWLSRFDLFKVSSLEMVCRQHETSIKQKDGRIHELETELNKHTQLAALIHNLSSGKAPTLTENIFHTEIGARIHSSCFGIKKGQLDFWV